MTAHTDYYGFELSTSEMAAANAYDKGAQSFVAWRADTMDHLNAAISADPFFFGAKDPKSLDLTRWTHIQV